MFTGHVLDENLLVSSSDEQIAYTVFKNIEDATQWANLFIDQKPNIECVILDRNEKLLAYLKADRW